MKLLLSPTTQIHFNAHFNNSTELPFATAINSTMFKDCAKLSVRHKNKNYSDVSIYVWHKIDFQMI